MFQLFNIIHFCILIVLFLALDLVWFSFAGDFFNQEIGPLLRRDGDSISPRIAEAFVVYLLMALSITLFVFQNEKQSSLSNIILRAGLLGLCCFGIYDFTNRAVLTDYTLTLAIADTAWGTVLYMATASLSFLARTRLPIK